MTDEKTTNQWHIFKGDGRKPHNDIERLPNPPDWRAFKGDPSNAHEPPPLDPKDPEAYRGQKYKAGAEEVEMVNAALYLRRPLLVTGPPGAGKSSLAYAVAWELNLGPVLHWPITTRATIQDGLYSYDAIGRLQESQMGRPARPTSVGDGADAEGVAACVLPDVGRFVRLGPLGTALLPAKRPRAVLIDEIDKSDIDLPNDLLNAFEEGRFPIPELVRLGDEQTTHVYPWKGKTPDAAVTGGEVVCSAFPFVVMTSNRERELPRPFLRRCIRLDIDDPTEEKLAGIVRSHFGERLDKGEREVLIQEFLNRRTPGSLATDQLLNAVYLTLANVDIRHAPEGGKSLLEAVLRRLDDAVRP